MLEDRVTLGSQLLRTQWNAHLDVLNLPLCPSTTIHPDAAVLQPLCTSLLLLVDGCQNSIGTFLVGSVWVGKVASHINLMRLYLLQQGSYHLYVLLCHRQLLNFSTLIEWQIKEVYMVERNLIIGAGSASLTTANQSLDGQDVASIKVALLLIGKEVLDFLIFIRNHTIL